MRALLVFLLTVSAYGAEGAPTLRLPDWARPIQYAAELTVLPDSPEFQATIDVDFQLSRASDVLWLNGIGLTIGEATIQANGVTAAATAEPAGSGFLGFRFPAPIPAGRAKLHVSYRGKISPQLSAGLFQGKDAGNLYVLSQFEAVDARRAFPCFDEPGFKVPWQLTLHVKREHVALSNTPELSEADEPNGMKVVRFQITKPLPSYLVALAVGPFELVPAGTAGRNHVPVRIVVPKGHAAEAKYAAEVTGPILEQLENYFGIPYPYEKLDSVAMPLAYGFGAMENAGLVTYVQTILLANPARDTINRQRTYASVAAHELAHQWFGDLVTMAWWDDTWLNEAFATWTSSKIIAGWKPEWQSRVTDQGPRLGVMEEDSLVSARKIRQPILSNDDVANAFDNITYQKGAAVIRMFETWVGEAQFRTGVQSYLKRYEFKNARSSDFLDALSNTGQPRLTKAFSTFLEQPGVPVISVALRCGDSAVVHLAQKRAIPLGSAGAAPETWQVPVCVRYSGENGEAKECFLLDKPEADFRLTKTATCPTSLSGNADASGYYRVAYEGDLLSKLLAGGGKQLSAAEKVALLGDLEALVAMGEMKPSEALKAVPVFADDPQRQVVTAALGIAVGVRPFLTPDLYPNQARFIQKVFGPRAEKLGWEAKADEDPDTRLLRAALVPAVATWGNNKELRRQARALADKWLQTRQGIQPDMLNGILRTAAANGNRAFFDRLNEELKKTQDKQQRGVMFGALGTFRDPEIAKASLNLLLSPEIDLRETNPILFGLREYFTTERLPFLFVQANFDALVARMPSGTSFDYGSRLPNTAAQFCDPASLKEVGDFFGPRVAKSTGGTRTLAQVEEGIRLCISQKQHEAPDIAEFFRAQ